MSQSELSPFEIGTVAALSALVTALKRKGSLDSAELEKLALHFKNHPPQSVTTPAQISAYEWAFAPLLGETSGVETVLGS